MMTSYQRLLIRHLWSGVSILSTTLFRYSFYDETGSRFDLACISSLSSERLCVFDDIWSSVHDVDDMSNAVTDMIDS